MVGVLVFANGHFIVFWHFSDPNHFGYKVVVFFKGNKMEKYFDDTHILLSRKISTKLYIILWSIFIALAIYLLANLSFLNIIFLILSLFAIVIISLYFKSFNYFFTTKNIIFSIRKVQKSIFFSIYKITLALSPKICYTLTLSD